MIKVIKSMGKIIARWLIETCIHSFQCLGAITAAANGELHVVQGDPVLFIEDEAGCVSAICWIVKKCSKGIADSFPERILISNRGPYPNSASISHACSVPSLAWV